MRYFFQTLAGIATAAIALIIFTQLAGCASLAQAFEKQISSAIEPVHVVFKDDRIEIYREYCAKGECLKRMEAHELVTFELGDGVVVKCKVSEEIFDHVDGSQNHWIWPIASNDERCTELLEGAAEVD